VVGYGCYRIVGDSLVHNLSETILMAGTVGSMVNIMKQELQVDDTFLQCYDVLAFFVFIELYDFSLNEDLTLLPLSTELSKGII